MHGKNSQMVKKVLLALADKKNLKGLKGVAAYIGVPETTVYGWVRNGNIADTGPILAMFPDVNLEWLRTGGESKATTATNHAIAITGQISQVGSIEVGGDLVAAPADGGQVPLSAAEAAIISALREIPEPFRPPFQDKLLTQIERYRRAVDGD